MELDQLRDYPVNGVYVISHGMFAQSVCVCVCVWGGGGGGGGRGGILIYGLLLVLRQNGQI